VNDDGKIKLMKKQRRSTETIDERLVLIGRSGV
jgi:hypothetical protein